ncbi:MAG: aldolase/citrate lyase family protein [Geminicoccaceae bacterium]
MSEESFLGGSGGRPILERALRLKEKLKSGGHVIGAWLSVTDPTVAEIMAHAGFDYVLIETEHSPWSLDKLQTAVMAFNGSATVPMARVPWNDQVVIKQYLDLGIEGILAPMVRTPEEAAALVAACRYPPVGRRGFGPRRASNFYKDIDTYMARANDAIFVMPQIEDIATLERLDELVAVPGLDAICIGPNDLSGTAGLLRQTQHPTIKAALDRIIATAAAAGLPACLGVNTPPERQVELCRQGVRVLLATSDLDLLIRGAANAIAACREQSQRV